MQDSRQKLAKMQVKEAKIMEGFDCPKIQDLVHEEKWLRSSYPFRHKTILHWGERKEFLFGNWTMHHLYL